MNRLMRSVFSGLALMVLCAAAWSMAALLVGSPGGVKASRPTGPTGATPTPTQVRHPAWSIVSSPNMGDGSSGLAAGDALAPDDVWAVGCYTVTDSTNQTLVEGGNGKRRGV